MKKILLFISCLIIFSFSIHVLKNYYFWVPETETIEYIEENYIEPTISDKYIILEQIEEEEELKSANNTYFYYFPKELKSEIKEYTSVFKQFLDEDYIKDKIVKLKVENYKNMWELRWRMKAKTVKLFWVLDMSVSEYLAVWIHEFAHYIDLYYLRRGLFTDVSNYFYNISWESKEVIKWWLDEDDFVSSYAETNMYEDFAESFTYFVLHNWDFLKKAEKSEILKQKYDFFNRYIFKNNEFENADFSIKGLKIEEHFRDTTAIEFSLKKFLEFLEK